MLPTESSKCLKLQTRWDTSTSTRTNSCLGGCLLFRAIIVCLTRPSTMQLLIRSTLNTHATWLNPFTTLVVMTNLYMVPTMTASSAKKTSEYGWRGSATKFVMAPLVIRVPSRLHAAAGTLTYHLQMMCFKTHSLHNMIYHCGHPILSTTCQTFRTREPHGYVKSVVLVA